MWNCGIESFLGALIMMCLSGIVGAHFQAVIPSWWPFCCSACEPNAVMPKGEVSVSLETLLYFFNLGWFFHVMLSEREMMGPIYF